MSTHRIHPQRAWRRSDASAGFTLIELLVTISIIVVAAALTLPSISQIIRSNNNAAALNTVSATLNTARNVAMRRQNHAGVAFLWDAQREVMTLQIIELGPPQLGRLSDTSGNHELLSAAVFWPVASMAAVELPRGTGVYGLAMGYRLRGVQENGGRIDADTAHWYAGWYVDAGADQPLTSWLFPNNDPRTKLGQGPVGNNPNRIGIDPFDERVVSGSVAGAGPADVIFALRHSQSFMVLFTPRGEMTTNIRVGGKTVSWAYLEYPDGPRVRNATPTTPPFDKPLLFDPEAPVENSEPKNVDRRVPNPEVLLAPVPVVSVVDLKAMGEGLNPADPAVPQFQDDGRLIADRRPWLIMPERVEAWPGAWPRWVRDPVGSRPYFDDERYAAVCRWIDRNGEIISFNRYTGQLLRSTRQ